MGRPSEDLASLIMVLLAAIALLPAALVMLPLCGAASGLILSISDCSNRFVPESDKRVSTVVSQPKAIATTAHKTATPSVRRTHSPAPRDCFRAANTRPPARMATAKEVAAPAA